MKLTESKIRKIIKVHGKASSSNSLYGQCPYCKEFEFGISLEKNHYFNCFRKKHCGKTGNIFTLIKDFGVVVDQDFQVKNIEKLENPFTEQKDKVKSNYKLPVGYKRVFKNDYLDKRGFTEKDYFEYEVGISSIFLRNYIIFPIKQRDQYVGHVARSIYSKDYCESNDIIRYKNSEDDLSDYLYGEVGSTTILVEGIFDKIATDKKLGLPCCSTFGAKISDNQIRNLLVGGCQKILLCFDGDVPSIIQKAANTLNQFFSVEVIDTGDKDPDELSKDIFIEKAENRKNFINFTTLKRL